MSKRPACVRLSKRPTSNMNQAHMPHEQSSYSNRPDSIRVLVAGRDHRNMESFADQIEGMREVLGMHTECGLTDSYDDTSRAIIDTNPHFVFVDIDAWRIDATHLVAVHGSMSRFIFFSSTHQMPTSRARELGALDFISSAAPVDINKLILILDQSA